MDVKEYLGPLLFVKTCKRHFLKDDNWFCDWITVQGPRASGDKFRLPCYRRVVGDGVQSPPEGNGARRLGCEEASGAQEKLGVGERRRGNRALGQKREVRVFSACGRSSCWSWHAAAWSLGRGVSDPFPLKDGPRRHPWQAQGRGFQEKPHRPFLPLHF